MANLRNAAIDRRRLRENDRVQYKAGDRVSAIKRAKAYRGRMAQQRNSDQFRTERNPGTGGFTQGRAIQQARLREVGDEQRRSESLRGI
tara:strand:- start:378 stop:644 length:267 start_codon:yes stop_codon:yes gene_type:complete